LPHPNDVGTSADTNVSSSKFAVTSLGVDTEPGTGMKLKTIVKFKAVVFVVTFVPLPNVAETIRLLSPVVAENVVFVQFGREVGLPFKIYEHPIAVYPVVFSGEPILSV
jgi:hypothetical protein